MTHPLKNEGHADPRGGAIAPPGGGGSARPGVDAGRALWSGCGNLARMALHGVPDRSPISTVACSVEGRAA